MSSNLQKAIIFSLVFLCAAVLFSRVWADESEVLWTFPTIEYEIDRVLEATKPTACMRDLTEQRIVCMVCHHKDGTLRSE